MANNTKNYNLIKPTENEVADIGVINRNMDAVDEKLKKNEEALAEACESLINFDCGSFDDSAADILTHGAYVADYSNLLLEGNAIAAVNDATLSEHESKPPYPHKFNSRW